MRQTRVIEDAYMRQHPANGSGQILQTAAIRLEHLQTRQIHDAIRYERDAIVVEQQLVEMLALGQLDGQSFQIVFANVQRFEKLDGANVCELVECLIGFSFTFHRFHPTHLPSIRPADYRPH